MSATRPFRQVDVFTETMQRFSHWTNLSETTFLLPPADPAADYLVRIFTPTQELPFAGHPTLGTAHAWLESGGKPSDAETIVQECGAGLIQVRRAGDRLAFAEPPLVRSGPVDQETLERVAAQLRGPGRSRHRRGLHPQGSETALEVRAFFPKDGSTAEDPVTGSLNASLAGWLIRSGRLGAPYVASQGTALGRAGRVHISMDDDGVIWVGGGTVTCIEGEVEI